jgi:hypothetical protein
MTSRAAEPKAALAGIALAALALSATSRGEGPATAPPEERAIAFLSREVPRWSRENRCFSCHNNGDAARALYEAVSRGFALEDGVLAETTRWLREPDGWDRNGGDGPFSDKRLARVQFAAALTAAHRAGRVKDRQPLLRAGDRLVRDQGADGSWPLEGEDEPGSPATYGRLLATSLARESLRAADTDRFRGAIEKAGAWIFRHEVASVVDASVMLMATAADTSDRARLLREKCFDLIRRVQSDDGGWGPFAKSPPEVFDTALAVLALAKSRDEPRCRPLIVRGRSFLAAQQQPDGGWIETTRPRGAESYAQRISTSGWATLALLATREITSPAGEIADPKRNAHGRRLHP